jgi:hypothetical protein
MVQGGGMASIERSITGGPSGLPFNSVAADIASVGGVEEEFLFEGAASQYRLANGLTEYGPDGHWAIEPTAQQPFRSRMIVVRPGDTVRFNGTVVVMWNNVSRGQDSFVGPDQAVRLLADGFAIAGVSAQQVGVRGLPRMDLPAEFENIATPGSMGLRGDDPDRYGSLEHPGDGFSYDIFTQAAQLLGQKRSGAIDPLGGLEVRHLVAMGGSQSANRLATYVNAFQPVFGALDAFLLTVYAGCPCSLNPESAPETLPQVPTNTVHLLPWRTFRLREDLEVPIIVLNSEFEAEQCHPNTQADTELLRWWEVAGTAHGGLIAPEELAVFVTLMPSANQVSFAPASRAALHALHRWLDGNGPPPHQPRLAKEGQPPALPRDQHGNAIGGIRWPDIEAPLGTYVGECPPGGFVQLFGASSPFSAAKIRSLYPTHQAWLDKYERATRLLVEAQVVLPDDAEAMIARASTSGLAS